MAFTWACGQPQPHTAVVLIERGDVATGQERIERTKRGDTEPSGRPLSGGAGLGPRPCCGLQDQAVRPNFWALGRPAGGTRSQPW